jgi:hypothetical protein
MINFMMFRLWINCGRRANHARSRPIHHQR